MDCYKYGTRQEFTKGYNLVFWTWTTAVATLLGMIWFLVQLIWYSYYSQLPKVGKFKLQDITDPDEELINFERDGIINQKVCASDNYISQ